MLNEERKQHFLSIITAAHTFYLKQGMEINFGFIKNEVPPEFSSENEWNATIETHRLLKCLYYLELLVHEKLSLTASDPWFYEF